MTSEHNRVNMELRALLQAVKDLENAFRDLFDDHILWQQPYERDPSKLEGGCMQNHVFAYLRGFIRAVEGPPDLSFADLTESNNTTTKETTKVLRDGVADILRLMQDEEMIPLGIDEFIACVLYHIKHILLSWEISSDSESPSPSEGSGSNGESSESNAV